MNKPLQKIRQLLSTRHGMISASLIGLLLLSLLFMPYGIQYILQKQLASLGATYIKIEDVDFNPFTRTLVIRNLVSGDKDIPYFKITEASLTLASWLPLFKSRLYFDDITIRDSLLNIEKYPDGNLRIGLIKTGAKKNNKQDTVGFGTNKLIITDSKLHYVDSEKNYTVTVKQASTDLLASWMQERTTKIHLRAAFDKATGKFSGNIKPFSEEPQLSGKLTLSHFPLKMISAGLLPEHMSLQGDLDSDTTVSVSYPKKSGSSGPRQIESVISGSAELVNTVMGSDNTPDRLWQSGKITIKDLQLTNLARLTVQTVDIDEFVANFHRDAKGRWQYIQDILDYTAANKQEKSDGVTFAINKLAIAPDSTIRITDQVVDPDYQLELKIEQAELTKLDSSRPDQPAAMLLAAKIDEYSGFDIKGELQPFATKTNLDMAAEIKSLDLPPISAYTRHYLGYVVNSGHMNSDLQLRIKDDVIDAKAVLEAKRLKVSVVDKEKSQPLSKALSLPLETALDTLRDKNDVIKLTVPVTGNIKDPSFDYSDAVNQATGKALKVATLGFLKYSLGPFGALITVGQLAGELAGGIRLESVKFAPGKAELDNTAIDYLQRIAEVLQKRPGLSIKICPLAVTSDKVLLPGSMPATEMTENLNMLARSRGTVIKDYLVKQLSVDPERLLVCLPEVMLDSDTPPHAGLVI